MSEKIMRANLIVLAQTFAAAKGWALTTVSKKIHGDQNFLARYLAEEGSTRIDTYFRMVNKLRALWPVGLEWPKTLPVPKLSRVVVADRKMPPRVSGTGRFLGKNRSAREKKVHKRARA